MTRAAARLPLIGPAEPAVEAAAEAPCRVEAELWQRHAAHPSPATREPLVLRYLPLARAIARHTLRRNGIYGVDIDDVMQAAYEGLIQAVDRFHAGLGHRFSAFAGFRVEGAVLNSLATMTEVQQQIAARVRVRRERVQSLHAAPVGSQAAAVEALASVSIGLALGFMLEGTGLYDDPALPCRTQDSAYESLAWRQAQQNLRSLVRGLRDDERRVLEFHYFQGLSFQQVAQLLGLSAGRISQLHRQALHALRRAMADHDAGGA